MTEFHDHGFNKTASSLLQSFQQFDLALAIITAILTLFCLLFNVCMCYVFWELRKSANALIFLNLAVVDVLLALIVMPYSVMVLLTRSSQDGVTSMVFCAVSGFIFEMSVYCTVGFIFLASADRFLGVYHPIFHRKYLCRQNLLKLILLVWVISPCFVFCYIIPWLFFISSWNVYTDLHVFTVCHGEYWWKHDHHPLANVPMYSGGTMLLVVIILIVVGNLAVLKQLLKKRQSPMANLQERKKSIAFGMAPPIFHKAPHNSMIDSDQFEQLSREDSEAKRSDRIFETDSTGDITGINIKAIMKLYLSSVRKSTKDHSTRYSPQTTTSDEEHSGSENPSYLDRTETPNLSTKCESLVEEEEQEEEEEEEDEDDLLSLDEFDLDSTSVCDLSELGMMETDLDNHSISISPEDEDFDLEGGVSDQAVWKVIKFVATLKRNSKKKQLCRSISDSEINFLSHSFLSDEEETASSPKHRNYSVMTQKLPNGVPQRKNKSYSDAPLVIIDRHASPSGLDMIQSNGGYMSPLAEANMELASLISIITKLKKKSKEAKERTVLRNGSPILASPDDEESLPIDDDFDDVAYQPFDNSGDMDEDSGSIEDYSKSESPLQKISLGTLGLVAKFKNKLKSATASSTNDEEEDTESEIELEEEEESEDDYLEMFGGYAMLHEPPSAPTPPPINSRRSMGRENLFLNTITEEEPDEDPEEEDTESLANLELRGYFVDDDENEKDDAMGTNYLAVPSICSPHSSHGSASPINKKRVSRSKSLDSIQMVPSMKARRGGLCLKQFGDDADAPSPGPSITPTGRRPSQMQHCASAFRRRMRASSVYKMSQRNSVNIASVAQMVYNFNKHARKKKKEIRAAKTVIILVFYYIITLVSFMISFYYLITSAVKDRQQLPYWLTFYSYVIYLNAMFNPVIHFWRNKRVRTMVTKVVCLSNGFTRPSWRLG